MSLYIELLVGYPLIVMLLVTPCLNNNSIFQKNNWVNIKTCSLSVSLLDWKTMQKLQTQTIYNRLKIITHYHYYRDLHIVLGNDLMLLSWLSTLKCLVFKHSIEYKRYEFHFKHLYDWHFLTFKGYHDIWRCFFLLCVRYKCLLEICWESKFSRKSILFMVSSSNRSACWSWQYARASDQVTCVSTKRKHMSNGAVA